MTEAEEVDYVNQLKSVLGIKDNESSDDLVMIYPPIEFSDEELAVLCNTEEWKKGYKLGAELGGLYTVLINSGMDVVTAGAIVANEHAMRVNVATQKVINDGVKLQSVAVKKTQL
jgi:hypothetical protein